jgi:hypothetical protein
MTTMIDATTPPAPALYAEREAHQLELLFKEAKRRQRRRRLRLLSFALTFALVVGAVFGVTYRAFASSSNAGAPTPALAAASSAKILTCRNTAVARPTTFVISCADGNTALTKTHWTTWNANEAVGTTSFAINLCTPDCAASKMSYFPGTVHFSEPVATKQGKLFSLIVVRYKMGGASKFFRFSFKGDPSF